MQILSDIHLVIELVAAIAGICTLLIEELNRRPRLRRIVVFLLFMWIFLAIVLRVLPSDNPFNSGVMDVYNIPSNIQFCSNIENCNSSPGYISLETSKDGNISYRINFTSDGQYNGNVGLLFHFNNYEDISRYKWIKIVVIFSHDPMNCKISLYDVSNNVNSIESTIYPPESNDVVQLGRRRVFNIPIEPNFEYIDLSILKRILIESNPNLIPSGENGYLIIEDVQFLEQ